MGSSLTKIAWTAAAGCGRVVLALIALTLLEAWTEDRALSGLGGAS